MQVFMQGVYDFVTSYKSLIYLLAACALVLVGIMLVIPSDEIHKKALKAIPGIVIGVGLVVTATTLAQEISSSFNF